MVEVKTIKVRATKLGRGKIRLSDESHRPLKVGVEFEIPEDQLTNSWMERVDGKPIPKKVKKKTETEEVKALRESNEKLQAEIDALKAAGKGKKKTPAPASSEEDK